MNYGKKLLCIIMSAIGMYIMSMGWAFKIGYFQGHSQTSAYFLLIFGLVVTVFGLYKLHQLK